MPKVKYMTFGKSSIGDPKGFTDPAQESELIDAELLPNGNLEIPEYNLIMTDVPEGTTPGTWQRISRIPNSNLQVVRNMFVTLTNDPDPVVANAAKVMIDIITGNKDLSLLNALRNNALNGANQTLRLFSILLIGLTVIEERD